jgi:hypothetical protein
MLARADTIVAIERDEAAVLQRKLRSHEIVGRADRAAPDQQASDRKGGDRVVRG